MKKCLVVILLGAIATASIAGMEDAYDKTTDGQKIGWMDRGKDLVKDKLKDPSSAQFRNVYFHRNKGQPPITCGEVNSKNGFGGYVGFQPFLSAGTPEFTVLREDVSDFKNLWNRLCR